MTFHSSGQAVFGFSHIEGITLDADEKKDEIAGRVIGMDVDKRGIPAYTDPVLLLIRNVHLLIISPISRILLNTYSI